MIRDVSNTILQHVRRIFLDLININQFFFIYIQIKSATETRMTKIYSPLVLTLECKIIGKQLLANIDRTIINATNDQLDV